MKRWLRACVRPKVLEDTGTDAAKPKVQTPKQFETLSTSKSKDIQAPEALQDGTRLCDSPSELVQALQRQQRQNDGGLDGHSLEQVQALWIQDQQAIASSLSGTLAILDRKLTAAGHVLPALPSPFLPTEVSPRPGPEGLDNFTPSSASTPEASNAHNVIQVDAAGGTHASKSQLPTTQSDVVRWIREHDLHLAAIGRLVQESEVLEAEKLLKYLMEEYHLTDDQLNPHAEQLGFNVTDVLHDADEARQMLHEMRDDSGWTVSSNGDLKILYRHHKGTPVHSVKMEATVECGLEQLLSLAAEYDLMSTWNKFILDAAILHAPSIFETTVYSATWLPFPLPQVDLMVTGKGFDLGKAERCLLVSLADGPEELPEGAQPLPKAARKRKRVSILPHSCFTLEELPPDASGKRRTKGTIMGHCDPHVPVPSFLITWVLKFFSPFAHKQIVALVASAFDDPSSIFAKRIAQKPDFYRRVRSKVEECMKLVYGPQTATAGA